MKTVFLIAIFIGVAYSGRIEEKSWMDLDDHVIEACVEAYGNLELLGDGNCDEENNIIACAFDAGDCSDRIEEKSWMDDLDLVEACAEVYGNLESMGDGICDEENNNDDCAFDAGDCAKM